MKVYYRVESRWDNSRQRYVIDEEKSLSFEYHGKLSLAGGGPSAVPQPPTTTTTVQQAEPWDQQKPYLETGFKKAQDLFLNTQPQLYPTSTVAPHSAAYNTALDATLNRALTGSPVEDAAKNQLTNTMNGAYLNNPTIQGSYLYGGPGFNAAVKAATDYALPQVDSAFEQSGRFNSGLARTAETKAIADAFAGQYGQERQLQEQNFTNERENQLRAMLFAPTIANQDYTDISQIAGVGAAQDADAQQALNEQVYRYTYGQNIQQNQLLDYLRAITGNYGTSGSSTGTQAGLSQVMPTSGMNPLMSGLGGALMGASAFGTGGALSGVLGLGAGGGGLLGGGLGLLAGFL